MRYTTIIDITENRAVWRNHNAALVYTLMVLRSGYHDDDRDIIRISLRDISWRLHITLSATRHAVRLLQSHGLIMSTTPGTYTVLKWVDNGKVTKRKTKREKDIAEQDEQRRQHLSEQLKSVEQYRQSLIAAGKTPLDVRKEVLRKKAAAGDENAARTLRQLEREQY